MQTAFAPETSLKKRRRHRLLLARLGCLSYSVLPHRQIIIFVAGSITAAVADRELHEAVSALDVLYRDGEKEKRIKTPKTRSGALAVIKRSVFKN